MSRSALVLIPARDAATSWLSPARLRNDWSRGPSGPGSPACPTRGSPGTGVLSDMASPSSDDRDLSIRTGDGTTDRARPTLQSFTNGQFGLDQWGQARAGASGIAAQRRETPETTKRPGHELRDLAFDRAAFGGHPSDARAQGPSVTASVL
ncbi:hypothetical protein GCM10014715_44330 [Streptomyces spiralis]|uniref:Uncharacterized protein n=1 Tax=Streptomyces spiralis TaxID=66376 RepID=A0A919A2K2_9ACTN|nr:hypothetical protein GCM10014715_44330 [Streptomyces spiralis]